MNAFQNGTPQVLEINTSLFNKYVVKQVSAKLFMMYAVGKLKAALNVTI